MLTGETAELVKATTGLDDEGLTKLHSGHEKLFNNVQKTMQIETICEVVKSEHCFAGVQVGDKLVFDPFLNTEKSTGVMCPKALAPIMPFIGTAWEIGVEWAASGQEELPEMVWRYVRCLDPGLNDGGVGGVVYKIYFNKMG